MSTIQKIAVIVITVLFIAVTGSYAKPLTLKIMPGAPNEVKFTSTAKIETVVGVTDQIDGSFTFDPEDLAGKVSGQIEVQMATLKTGNKIRDGHMRDNHLHTDKFPISRFTLDSLEGFTTKKMVDGQKMMLKAKGDFLCHGIAHPIMSDVSAVWNGKLQELEITATMTIKLSDYEIPLPQFLVLKLSNEQFVEIKFIAKP